MQELFHTYTTKFNLPDYTHIVMFDDGSGTVRSAKYTIENYEDILISFDSQEHLERCLQACIDNNSPKYGSWE